MSFKGDIIQFIANENNLFVQEHLVGKKSLLLWESLNKIKACIQTILLININVKY